MTRIRSTLATLLLMAAAVAALGIGAALAMAGLAIGLVVALAVRLDMTAQGRNAQMEEPAAATVGPAGTA